MVNDIWIFNKDSILAVGQFYLNNTNGNRYGKPIWYCEDGMDKNGGFKKSMTITIRLFRNYRGIFSFSGTDIWLADGGVYHWDGISSQMSASYSRISLNWRRRQRTIHQQTYGERVIERNSIRSGRHGGMIAHYNGASRQKMESGTTVDLNDIFGLDANHIWAIGTTTTNANSVILNIMAANG